MKSNNNAIFVLGGILIIGLLMWFLGRQPSPAEDLSPTFSTSTASTEKETITLGKDIEGDSLLSCDNSKAIGVNVFEEGVILNLSDGRSITLREVSSERSGSVYTNRSITFVSRGVIDPSVLTEGGVETFKNCLVQQGEF